jgi:hypothetical protein
MILCSFLRFVAVTRFSSSMAVGLIAGLLAVTTVSSAPAASLERLGDGRIVITAFGERLAFREKDARNVDFFLGLLG